MREWNWREIITELSIYTRLTTAGFEWAFIVVIWKLTLLALTTLTDLAIDLNILGIV